MGEAKFMDSLRLFIAISLPLTIKENLARLQKNLQASGANVKWVESKNFHLTLKFLGETPKTKCKPITRAIEEVGKAFSSFELKITNLGTFPSRGRPKVVWAGLGGNGGQLVSLQASLEQKLAHLGFAPENRKYSPHLTLGRVKEFGTLGDLTDRINQYKNENNDIWKVEAIELIQSTLTPSGPVYHVLSIVPLKMNPV